MPSELKYQDKNLLEGDLRSENCNGLDNIVSVLLFALSAVPFQKKNYFKCTSCKCPFDG